MRRMARWIALGALAAPAAGLAQGAYEEIDELVKTPEESWKVTADAMTYTILFQHDALQTRMNYETDRTESWRNGSSDGQGYGLRLAVAKGDGAASFRFISARSDYERKQPGFFQPVTSRLSPKQPAGVNGYHFIESDRNDFEMMWSQQAGRTESSMWGWDVGIRYIGVRKRMNLIEGPDQIRFNDDTTYYLLQGGYFGQWQPFKGPNLGVYATVKGLIGEVSGIARRGTDEGWDGRINEYYDQDYSLAYGARGEIGAVWTLRNGIRASINYQREWIYSFDAVDSGLVVFPDNSDALFIENVHVVMMSLGYAF